MNINNECKTATNNKGPQMTKLDPLMSKLRTKLSSKNISPEKILTELQAENKDFVMKQHGIYNYKNYYIFQGFREYFENDIEGYKIAKKTGAKSAPELIDVFSFPEQEIVMILQLPSENSELRNFDENLDKLSLVERLRILDEFKLMLNSDYINVSAANSTADWRLSSDNSLVLLLWNNLSRVKDPKEKVDYLDKIKQQLKINNDNPQHTFYMY